MAGCPTVRNPELRPADRPPAPAEDAPGSLAAQQSLVLGRQIELRVRDGHQKFRGELLAVRPDSIWLLNSGSIVSLTLSEFDRATVQRHSLTGSKALLWGLGVGLAAGGGLSIACSESDAESCGGVLAASMLLGLVFGGLAAISFNSSAEWRFDPPLADSLTRFARFPQGHPPAGWRSWIVRPRIGVERRSGAAADRASAL